MHLPDGMQAVLARGGTLVTANARAARSLRRAHAEVQRAAGLAVWPTPLIHDWESWLALLWKEHLFTAASSGAETAFPMLLSSLQERAVWREAMTSRGDVERLIAPDGMTAMAQQAYALLSDYERHAERNRAWYAQSDAESFRAWAAAFDRECARNGWLSESSLPALLTKALRDATLPPPGEILLIGFDRMTPVQRSLVRTWGEKGGVVAQYEPDATSDAQTTLVCANDAMDEITTCAWWVRDLLARQPGVRIGVLATDVAALRGDMERIFLRVLAPESASITAAPSALPFEFALGVPLATVPLVRAALLLLRWMTAPLLEEEVTWLGLCGFLSASEPEYLSLAAFDSRRRDAGALSPEISLSAFLAASETRSAPPARAFLARLRDVQRTAIASELSMRKRGYSDWTGLAGVLLAQAAWPGARALPSVEFQAREKWEQMLDELATLDFDGSRVSFDDFLSSLQRRTAELIFSPQSQDAPMQISGVFEASGEEFDAVWFLGADDENWPANARAHPLLPLSVQRDAEMPHSSAAVDWQLARAATLRVAASAPTCVFSYARQDKYGALRPSPLLREVSSASLQIEANDLRERLQASLGVESNTVREPGLECIDDDSGTLPWNAALSAGGADVLKMQAACPFQAFAAKRLRADALNRTEWGLSAPERGNILHRVLERLWSPETDEPWRLRSLDDLLRVRAENRLDAVLEHHTLAEFQGLFVRHSGDAWMQGYLQQEQQRLCLRLREWLEQETVRRPFLVEQVEQRLDQTSIGGLRLRLRADRIDLLPDGGRLIIDYKTGQVSASQWNGERPDEPQLPLYATFGGVVDVRGILFAQIRAGDTTFIGRVEDAVANLNPRLTKSSPLVKDPYTPELRDAWRTALETLAAQFLAGDAAVDPKQREKTCRHCEFPGLCRVAEAGILHGIENDDLGDGEESANA